MKINKIFVKNKNTNYTIIIGKGSLGKLKIQINKLCPKTKKIGLIIDKNIPNNFKIKIKKQLRKYSLYVYEFKRVVVKEVNLKLLEIVHESINSLNC